MTPSPARQFRLPQVERAAPEPQPRRESPRLQVASDREPYRYRERDKAQTPARNRPARGDTAQTTRRGASVTVHSPIAPRDGRTLIDFTCATSHDMPAMFGTVRLRCEVGSVDLSRVSSGLLALAIDHDTTRLMGRITSATITPGKLDMVAEIGNTPTAKQALAEMREYMRRGFSPGFVINAAEPLPSDDPAFDKDLMQTVITDFMPYEASTTAIPRSGRALLRQIASMEGTTMNGSMEVRPMTTQTQGLQAPEIVSFDDPVGLSISAGRAALRGGKGSQRQRQKLAAFFRIFDDERAAGRTQDEAAALAKEAAGI